MSEIEVARWESIEDLDGSLKVTVLAELSELVSPGIDERVQLMAKMALEEMRSSPSRIDVGTIPE